jgi:hypothetical protein
MSHKRLQVKVTVDLGTPDPAGLERLVNYVAMKIVADILNKGTARDSADSLSRDTQSGGEQVERALNCEVNE